MDDATGRVPIKELTHRHPNRRPPQQAPTPTGTATCAYMHQHPLQQSPQQAPNRRANRRANNYPNIHHDNQPNRHPTGALTGAAPGTLLLSVHWARLAAVPVFFFPLNLQARDQESAVATLRGASTARLAALLVANVAPLAIYAALLVRQLRHDCFGPYLTKQTTRLASPAPCTCRVTCSACNAYWGADWCLLGAG